MNNSEKDRLCQLKDEQTNSTIINSLLRYYSEKGITAKITKNNDRYGCWDFKIELDGVEWYCESKERNYFSYSFATDFFERKKLNEMRKISNNILYFASFNKDKMILVYDLRKVNGGKIAVINTEKYTMDSSRGTVDKQFLELDKKSAILKLKW
jgi:hypothetical protein